MGIDFKKKKKDSFLDTLEKKKSNISSNKNQNFVVSFADFDSSQRSGSSFKDWDKIGLLSTMLSVFQGYCCSPLQSSLDSKFTIYGDFPPADKTKFARPTHVAEDAQWARIHLNNKTIVAGHVINNTFYVVFLDKFHHFYISEKKNT